MATAKTTTIVDGRIIRAGEEIPDLGSWTPVRARGSVRDYKGLSKDVGLLPHYVATGSRALCLDTGDVYEYEKSSGTWHKQGRHGGSGDGAAADYLQMGNKPRINGVELSGDVSLGQLGVDGFVSETVMGGVKLSVDMENRCLQIEYAGP